MLLYKVVFEDIIRTKYKPGTGIMAAIKILRIEGNWGRSSCLRFTPAGWCAGKACLPQMAQPGNSWPPVGIRLLSSYQIKLLCRHALMYKKVCACVYGYICKCIYVIFFFA